MLCQEKSACKTLKTSWKHHNTTGSYSVSINIRDIPEITRWSSQPSSECDFLPHWDLYFTSESPSEHGQGPSTCSRRIWRCKRSVLAHLWSSQLQKERCEPAEDLEHGGSTNLLISPVSLYYRLPSNPASPQARRRLISHQ